MLFSIASKRMNVLETLMFHVSVIYENVTHTYYLGDKHTESFLILSTNNQRDEKEDKTWTTKQRTIKRRRKEQRVERINENHRDM